MKVQVNLLVGIFFRLVPFLALVFTFYHCSKESTIQSNSSIDNIAERGDSEDEVEFFYEYKLDGVTVSGITNDSTTDNWVAYIVEHKPSTNDAIVNVYKFSTKSAYIQFGSANNLAIGKGLQIAEHLRHIADSSGVIAQYETTGTIPSWYSEYEEDYYESTFLQGAAEDRNIFISLYKKCEGGGIIPMFRTYPVMPPTWNNKVSKVQTVGIYAGTAMFDFAFYNTHIGTIWLFGFETFCLEGTSADNKMSSGFKLL